MERLKQLTYSLCLLMLLGLLSLGSNIVYAQSNPLTQQLAEISQNPNKKQAAEALSQLINSGQYLGENKFKILHLQGKNYISLHQYSQGIDAVTEGKQLAEAVNSHGLIAQADKLLGVLCYYQGELKSSLHHYQESLAYYEENRNTHPSTYAIERANLFNNIALVYTSLGQSSLALKQYQLAEPLYAKYGDEVDKIDVRYNIAVLHINLRRFDSAIDILKVVTEKRQQLNDYYGVATAKADIGVAYRYSGEFELAKENLLEALEYFQSNGHQFDVASHLHNISEVYLDLFEVEEALKNAHKALSVSEAVGHQRAYAGSLHSLAKAYFYTGDLVLAEHYLKSSGELAKKLDFKALLIENLAISALINAGNERYADALIEQQLYEKEYQINANNTLNDKLAEFESEQLNQQIVDLENRRKLQNLESAKIEQQRNVIILAFVLVLMMIFFLYRRYLERRVTLELELRVKQRTKELEEITHELEKAVQVKNQFLANMSHEIRTPLTAIVGHSEELIHDEIDTNKVKNDIKVIHGNSLHLLELINDILDLSRLEANKFELESQPLETQELIQDLSHTFKAEAEKKQLKFSIINELPSPFTLYVDNLRLKQILLNLCSNAVKFTERGEVTLTVSKQEDLLSFAVADTGIGLSEAHLSQVFNLFSQADNSISRRFGGSGLGLALSKQLATLMSGKITVQSELGKGSVFCLTLPCIHNKVGSPEQTASAVDLEQPAYNQHFKGKVLLAEDHDDNRRLIARLVSNLGLDVIEAKNGKEAVQLYSEHQPELILLDIQMPEMDGVEAFKALRGLGANQPIYALTANAMSHEVSHYLELGFTGHLKKPIERKNFIATIVKCFNDQHSNSLISTGEYIKLHEEALANVDLSDLVQEFKASLIKDKQNIISYNNQKDIEALAKISHQLAGAAQMFGFVEINQAAKELEQAIKSETRSGKLNFSFIKDLADCLIDEINAEEQK